MATAKPRPARVDGNVDNKVVFVARLNVLTTVLEMVAQMTEAEVAGMMVKLLDDLELIMARKMPGPFVDKRLSPVPALVKAIGNIKDPIRHRLIELWFSKEK